MFLKTSFSQYVVLKMQHFSGGQLICKYVVFSKQTQPIMTRQRAIISFYNSTDLKIQCFGAKLITLQKHQD